MFAFPKFLVSLQVDCEWYDIRDTFFGENFRKQNIPLAIERAAKCTHPDAEWLTAVFAGKDIQNSDEARKVFSLLGNDARALCFTWMLRGDESMGILEKSAELGYALAQAELGGWKSTKRDQYELCLVAAVKAEREAFYELGRWYRRYESAKERPKYYYKMAADLGCIRAACDLANILPCVDPEKWRLWGICEARGLQTEFVAFVKDEIATQKKILENRAVAFQIGRAFNGHVDKGIMFGRYRCYHICDAALLAIKFYKSQLESCRKAVDAWTIVGQRLHVCKDMRKMIGQIIWQSREEAKY